MVDHLFALNIAPSLPDQSHRRNEGHGSNGMYVDGLVVKANIPTAKIDLRHIAIPRVSVVLPTLNEAANLSHVMPRIPDWVHEVILVDGRSTDGTVDVARRLRPDVRVVLETRHGKGAALRAGFAGASGDIIVAIDADGSMNPEEMILLVSALLTGADFAKGSRFIEGGGSTDLSMIRALGNWALTSSVRLLYGCRFSDLCYGYMAFWRRALPLLESASDGFEIETMLCVRALTNRLKIAEIPSHEAERIHGVSHLRAIPDGWRVLKTILSERVAGSSSRGAPRGSLQ
jgi:glycosyltransferase involved in cell wall biosynthesis